LLRFWNTICLYVSASAFAIGIEAVNNPSASASAIIELELNPRSAIADWVALATPLRYAGNADPVDSDVSISWLIFANCPLTVASESTVPVAAVAAWVKPDICCAVIVGVAPATCAAVILAGVAVVCSVAAVDAPTFCAVIVGTVPAVGVAATTCPVKPGVAIASVGCTVCNEGVTLVPVGKFGVFNNVSITEITLRLPACSVVVGCNTPSGKVVVLGASVNAMFIYLPCLLYFLKLRFSCLFFDFLCTLGRFLGVGLSSNDLNFRAISL